jgi:hypothetical protein
MKDTFSSVLVCPANCCGKHALLPRQDNVSSRGILRNHAMLTEPPAKSTLMNLRDSTAVPSQTQEKFRHGAMLLNYTVCVCVLRVF